MTGTKPIDYSHLSTQERILLAEELWESVHDAAVGFPLTEAQEREVRRRWDAFEDGEMTASPWPDVKKRLSDQ
jgi:putative addiction module component (TIGR02574 family)